MQLWGNSDTEEDSTGCLYLTCAFLPESSDKFRRAVTKAGLLTYSSFLQPSRLSRQWQQVAKKLKWSLQHRVMSGIFTRFPFHPIQRQEPFAQQKYKVIC